MMHKMNFFKKEIQEFIKTPKGLILLILFIFFGISSPLLAKYMNEILLSVASDIAITLPEPRIEDAWMQIYKNLSTICFIVYLIIMTGSISQEKNKGSIVLVLTKNVSRWNMIVSKFFGGVTIFTILYLLSILLGGWYTNILFGQFAYDGLYISLFIFWLSGVFFTALAIFVSVIGKTPTTAALLGFFGFALLQILNISSKIAMFNPAGALSLANAILTGSIELNDLWIQIIATILGTLLLLVEAFHIFRKQEI